MCFICVKRLEHVFVSLSSLSSVSFQLCFAVSFAVWLSLLWGSASSYQYACCSRRVVCCLLRLRSPSVWDGAMDGIIMCSMCVRLEGG